MSRFRLLTAESDYGPATARPQSDEVHLVFEDIDGRDRAIIRRVSTTDLRHMHSIVGEYLHDLHERDLEPEALTRDEIEGGMEYVEVPAFQHLARQTVEHHTWCEIIANGAEQHDWPTARRPPAGRCGNRPVAVKMEDGFSDAVCEEHGREAETRGAAVVWAAPRG